MVGFLCVTTTEICFSISMDPDKVQGLMYCVVFLSRKPRRLDNCHMAQMEGMYVVT